jgi:hypothetical protein
VLKLPKVMEQCVRKLPQVMPGQWFPGRRLGYICPLAGNVQEIRNLPNTQSLLIVCGAAMWVAGATLKPYAGEREQTICSQLFNNLGFKEISTFAFYYLSVANQLSQGH